MRQIILDTETTGLDPRQGHRLIEVAGVEMLNRQLTQRHFHKYVNPEREVDAGAQAVHGISNEFLADKPLFADIVDAFIDFVRDAELVIHNAAFDVGFLNAELARLGRPRIETICPSIIDTLKLARELHPGKRNNLDALCDRYQISNAHRTLHGALLDSELLAEVYLSMTRGQESLMMEPEAPAPGLAPTTDTNDSTAGTVRKGPRPPLKVIRASDDELASHQQALKGIDKASGGQCLWLAAEKAAAPEA
jgi:DNA polymerase-3 subunit epsilon